MIGSRRGEKTPKYLQIILIKAKDQQRPAIKRTKMLKGLTMHPKKIATKVRTREKNSSKLVTGNIIRAMEQGLVG